MTYIIVLGRFRFLKSVLDFRKSVQFSVFQNRKQKNRDIGLVFRFYLFIGEFTSRRTINP